ncbi:MAG: hypothetical protein M3N52_02105 [Actinomycetota bacterium]|nr:hypothetical protein [Actinomycetota bacterium]
MISRRWYAVVGSTLLLMTAGCDQEPSGGPPSAGAPAPGEALSVEQALASRSSEPLVVRGTLFAVHGDPVRLCSAILESYPPQCGGPSLAVEGADLYTIPGLETAGSVTWSTEPAELLGVVRAGVLTVSRTSI